MKTVTFKKLEIAKRKAFLLEKLLQLWIIITVDSLLFDGQQMDFVHKFKNKLKIIFYRPTRSLSRFLTCSALQCLPVRKSGIDKNNKTHFLWMNPLLFSPGPPGVEHCWVSIRTPGKTAFTCCPTCDLFLDSLAQMKTSRATESWGAGSKTTEIIQGQRPASSIFAQAEIQIK